MIKIASTYNNNEMGWVSEEFSISKPTGIRITLSKKGRVVVKKRNEIGGEQAKVLVTPISGPVFELMISGEIEGKYIQFVTSVEPEKIEIFGDVTPVEPWYLEGSTNKLWIGSKINSNNSVIVSSNTLWEITI